MVGQAETSSGTVRVGYRNYMTERWKEVAGYDGRYEISDSGAVRSHSRRKRGALMRRVFDTDGYIVVTLSAHGQCYLKKIHRLVLEAFRGPPPSGMVAAHLNGDRSDPRLENLAWVTPEENSYHRDHIHTTAADRRGDKSPTRKLSSADVERIRESMLFGAKQCQVARAYGVSDSTIYLIQLGKNWPSTSKSSEGV